MNRAEFMSNVYRVMSYPDAQKVEKAYLLAKKFHKGQFRKEIGPDGNPLRYFEHLRRTALILLDSGIASPDLIITALLHDSIEDSEEVELLSSLIQELFGDNVSDWVRALTKTAKDGYIDNLKFKMMHDGTPGFIIVKAADRLDNLRSLPADEIFRTKQLKETRDDYLPLFISYSTMANDVVRRPFTKILEEIMRAVT